MGGSRGGGCVATRYMEQTIFKIENKNPFFFSPVCLSVCRASGSVSGPMPTPYPAPPGRSKWRPAATWATPASRHRVPPTAAVQTSGRDTRVSASPVSYCSGSDHIAARDRCSYSAMKQVESASATIEGCEKHISTCVHNVLLSGCWVVSPASNLLRVSH